MPELKRLIVAATGASGMPILKCCLEILRDTPDYESWLILSPNAVLTIEHELGALEGISSAAHRILEVSDIGAEPASGSFTHEGMLIVPCSMKTLAGINSGYSDNLILRAADVCIKENRNLVLCTRESPLSRIHLRNMYELSQLPKVRIIPPMLSFYNRPATLDEMVYQISARLLEPFGIHAPGYRHWQGLSL